MKNKTKYFVILVQLIISSVCSYSQNISQEEKNRILAEINDENPFVQADAIEEAGVKGVREAIPIIIQKLWTDKTPHIIPTLYALSWLKVENLSEICYALIDSAEIISTRSSKVFYPLEIKTEAACYLFGLGDYTFANYIIETVKDTTHALDVKALGNLKTIVRHVPQFANEAKNLLLRISKNASYWEDRLYALEELVELYGTEMFDEIVYMACNDPYSGGSTRYAAIEMLFKLNYSELHTLLIKRMSEEPGWPYRVRFADSLLIHYGSPLDYAIVRDYQLIAPDPTEKSLIGRALQSFVPRVPDKNIPIIALLDSLISFQQQTVSLNWLGDQNFVKELTKKLDEAKKHLTKQHASTKDSVKCAKEVRKFQKKVDEVYQKTVEREKKHKQKDEKFVTVEGWKFLYYNAQYILDRLPALKKDEEEED